MRIAGFHTKGARSYEQVISVVPTAPFVTPSLAAQLGKVALLDDAKNAFHVDVQNGAWQ